MYHSILFGDEGQWIHTYEDWHLIPSSRPDIAIPAIKTNFVDIPGADGKLDLSEAITGYPFMNNREGSLEFYVLNGYNEWIDARDEIANFMHGREMKMVLEDQPDWYYEGRFNFNAWKSEKDYSKVVIDYDLYPYKKTRDTIEKVIFESSGSANYIAIDYDGIVPLVNRMPIVPSIKVENSTNGVTIKYKNSPLGIDISKKFTNGVHKWEEFILYRKMNTKPELSVSGAGKVTLNFQYGRI